MLKTATLFLWLLSTAVTAQITLTTDYFPAAGDTLVYAVAPGDFTIDLLTPGAERQWNFGSQVAVDTQFQIVRPYDGNPDFPDADLVVPIDRQNIGYYALTDTTYELIGIQGLLDDVFPGFTFDAPIDPARPQRRAPLQYEAVYAATTVNTVAVDQDSLPQEAIRQFGSLLSSVDSVRLVSTSVRDDVVDAYGTLTINGETFDVLRERRTETVTTVAEVKAPLLGPDYVDITTAAVLQEPDLGDFLGEQGPTTTYYYWTNTQKAAVAIVTVDENGTPTRMTFTPGDATNSLSPTLLPQAQVRVYPNPARNWTTFEVSGLDLGTYTLRVINMLGREVIRQELRPSGEVAKTTVDVSQLPRGPYIYSLTNERGRLLTTRRLLINR